MPSIAIIGAGPAGLTLARLLQVKCQSDSISNLKITIFEKDVSANARFDQGGTLDLHPTTGIAALKAANMWEGILPHMRYEGEELVIADINATEIVHIKSASDLKLEGNSERPEIDREILKEELLKAVQELGGDNAVTWGKSLARADAETGILTFKDGTEAGPFDLVIGADGAWSKIRNIVADEDVKPTYSGIVGFEARVDKEHSGQYWDQLSKFVGGGSYFAYCKHQSVMGQRMENGSMKILVWTMREESWADDVVQQAGGDDEKIHQALLREFSGWDNQLKLLISVGYKHRPWPLYELPVGHSWQHKKGFTLIGDSAHLMTPFAGEGVNAAMKDALDLSERIVSALTSGGPSLDDAVEKFEKDMFPRNLKVQGQTMRNKTYAFRDDAPIGFVTKMVELVASEKGFDASKGWRRWAFAPVRALVYSYFWSISGIGYVKRLLRDVSGSSPGIE